MAMTKAEKAYVEELERELAFRWPTSPEPAPMTQDEIMAAKVVLTLRDKSVFASRAAALGWCHNAYSQRVEPAWSTGTTHGRGNHTGDGGSQGMGRLYRTKAEAALVMRWEMCRDFARKLHAVDQVIAQGIVTPSGDETRSGSAERSEVEPGAEGMRPGDTA